MGLEIGPVHGASDIHTYICIYIVLCFRRRYVYDIYILFLEARGVTLVDNGRSCFLLVLL